MQKEEFKMKWLLKLSIIKEVILILTAPTDGKTVKPVKNCSLDDRIKLSN